MKTTGALKVTARGEREIVMVRVFDAPRRLVFEAFTRPELLRRWLLGPPGWSFEVCETGKAAGDKYRYVWRHEDGRVMGMGGVVLEFVPPDRIVSSERFDESWYPGEAIVRVEFQEEGGTTTLTQTLTYESREARDAVLRSPMESGVAMGYDRLAELLRSLASGEGTGRD